MADLVSPSRTYGLVDILDRVLDKGLVVVGDIKINLANVELLTIQVRLLICSIDTYLKYSEAVGLTAPGSRPRELAVGGADELDRMRTENADLKRRLERLQA